MLEPLRILIVEDEALLLMQLEETIEAEGHDIVGTAVSAGEAITLTRAVEPDVALIDLQLLDGPTGLDIARFIRAERKTLVVFITANASRVPEDYEGAVGLISKPFSQAGIVATLRYLHECVRRPPPQRPAPSELKVSPAHRRAWANSGDAAP